MTRIATATVVLALAIAAFSLAACGAVSPSESSDAGTRDSGRPDGQGTIPGSTDSGPSRVELSEGGPGYRDASRDSHATDSSAAGGGYVDAGYYFGDGSFWVDGGVYPDLPDASSQVGKDAEVVDAAPGCGALAACCNSLASASQSLCNAVVDLANAANCSTELAELQTGGDCTGVSVLASYIQLPPTQLLSDGTTLFFTDGQQAAGLFAVPVGGGTITTLVTGNLQLVAVDDVNLYILEGPGLIRLPKNGAAPTLISEAGASLAAVTTLGTTAYWLELANPSGPQAPPGLGAKVVVKSAPLLGGAVTTIAGVTLTENGAGGDYTLGVTSSTIFVGSLFTGLNYFPLMGGLVGTVPMVTGSLTSDTDAVYCDVGTGSNLRIASDGTMTELGPTVETSGSDGSPYIVFDETYAYWADNAIAGTIVKAPKAGGGTSSILARDTSPIAIAVDATSVYWSDAAGYIKSIPK